MEWFGGQPPWKRVVGTIAVVLCAPILAVPLLLALVMLSPFAAILAPVVFVTLWRQDRAIFGPRASRIIRYAPPRFAHA